MKVVVAIDSFKGSLSSLQAGKAASDGIKRVFGNADVKICPIADGGEGTVDAMSTIEGSVKQMVKVHGPLNKTVVAEYVTTNGTAIIEMSSAAGITLIEKKDLNPLNTTTYGVGEIIKDAIDKGCRKFIIGIGGSSTNDGGTGMLKALGFEFTDADGNEIPNGAKGLEKLCHINVDNVIPKLKECVFQIACDVKNPLCGNEGCSAVYGPQKGATPEMIEHMDQWLFNYSQLAKTINPSANPLAEGCGAAGGMGFAFSAFLNGELKPGIELIIKETNLEEFVEHSDMVITGEGRLDAQSAMGKVPAGVAKLAKKHNKPVIAFSGCVTEDAKVLNEYGIDAFFPILKNVCTLESAMNTENAYKNLADTAEQVFNLLKNLKNIG